MSNFYRSNLNEGNEISMATSSFFTDRVFESREEMMQWVQNATFSLGYIIVTRRSKAKENGVVSYVTLICDRGGEYKFKESSKKSGTKKTNCKFRLVGSYLKQYDGWTLRVICDQYNHPPAQHMEGHAYARRLKENEKNCCFAHPRMSIVGATSTNKTFSIAFAFIINEKEENYNWALSCLKLTLEECMYPRVIVMDRELALMNACQQVFPDATRLLCRWHITENIKKHCRQSIKSQHEWESFRVLKYLDQVWLSKYKEMFVSAWIDQHLNFGERTTNRIVKSQLTSIYESFEKSRIILKHRHNLPCFRLLRGFVAFEALNILEGELQRSNRHQLDSLNCGCKLRYSCGLSCACMLLVYLNSGECIPLDSIDVFWRKLNLSPSTSVENEDICYDGELEMFKENFTKQSKAGKKSLLRKLRDIFQPSKTLIKEPTIQKNTQISDMFHPYITHVQDVRGDGNCGFQAISICLDELLSSYDVYARVFIDEIDELRNSLCFSQSLAPAEHRMIMPMTGVLIANRFEVILNYLTKRGDITFFPLWRGPEHFQYHHAITIAHVYDNHNVMVQLEGDYLMPTISAYWIRHKGLSTAGWQTMFMSRLEFYRQLKPCNIKTPVITIEDYC
ncbi:hypothetical protein V6Z11_A10G172200 [Gossypium hirsutum]